MQPAMLHTAPMLPSTSSTHGAPRRAGRSDGGGRRCRRPRWPRCTRLLELLPPVEPLAQEAPLPTCTRSHELTPGLEGTVGTSAAAGATPRADETEPPGARRSGVGLGDLRMPQDRLPLGAGSSGPRLMARQPGGCSLGCTVRQARVPCQAGHVGGVVARARGSLAAWHDPGFPGRSMAAQASAVLSGPAHAPWRAQMERLLGGYPADGLYTTSRAPTRALSGERKSGTERGERGERRRERGMEGAWAETPYGRARRFSGSRGPSPDISLYIHIHIGVSQHSPRSGEAQTGRRGLDPAREPN
jgi:hypothetical protein